MPNKKNIYKLFITKLIHNPVMPCTHAHRVKSNVSLQQQKPNAANIHAWGINYMQLHSDLMLYTTRHLKAFIVLSEASYNTQ